jgi:RimJ/RimL family protein N-acetyltransferase
MNYDGLILTLRKPEKEDMAVMTSWLGDELFLKNLYGSPIDSYQNRFQTVHRFLNQNAKDFSNHITLIAVDKAKQMPIGLLMLNHINWKHRNAEMNAAIGDPKFRNAIYGGDLYLLGLLISFFELNLHKVFGYTYSSNEAALKLNNFGGKVNGILKKHVYRDGKFTDIITHSILKREFLSFLDSQKDKILRKHTKKGIFDVFGH